MDIIQLKQDLVAQLSQMPAYKNPNRGVQHVVRCPYCGDSIKSMNHGHFSIKIVPDNDFPIIYRCLRCDESGVFTDDTLKDLNLGYTGDMINTLHSMKRKAKKLLRKYNIITNIPQLSIPLYTDSNPNIFPKMQYLSERLGIDITPPMLQEMKVIPDIYDFVKLNQIENIPQVSLQKLDFLNRYYIGFISTNNNTITYRYMGDTKSNPNIRRYDKITINPYVMNPNSFYNTPIAFDLMYNHPINIHIAEGIFDILSIKYNLKGRSSTDNDYYFATCTFGYTRIIKYLLGIGLNTDINLHLYADKDKNDYIIKGDLKKIKPIIEAWMNETYIHRNIYGNEKDYGVPKERMEDSMKRFLF